MGVVSAEAVIIPISTALSNAFAIRAAGSLTVYTPATWTAASLGFQVSPTRGGTYVPLYNAAGSLVEVAVVVDTAVRISEDILGHGFVKLWSQTAGSGVNQAAARTLTIEVST